MKRSEINSLILEAKSFFKSCRFHLPPFADWSPETWHSTGPEADEIRKGALGWDLTDFGSNSFQRIGLLLFTLRNGHPGRNGGKNYAEKIMVVQPSQVTPWHYHKSKMEDIINRGGGNLCIELMKTDANGKTTKEDVTVFMDGIQRNIPHGKTIVLSPGESITMQQTVAHKFYGEPGGNKVMVGEVSDTNDDNTDNYFLDPAGRFPAIEEDAAPIHLLCNEYPPEHVLESAHSSRISAHTETNGD